jgi:hypothetical protein
MPIVPLTAWLSAPMIQHNVPINMSNGQVPGMGILLGGELRGASNRMATIIVRFTYPTGAPLMANPAEPQFRDVFGQVAVHATYPIQQDYVSLNGLTAGIPYYAMNFMYTGGRTSQQLRTFVQVYVDGFLVSTSQPADWILIW